MELQQQRMPGYAGLYGSHYDNPGQGFPGQGRHPLGGGYPFPPMPGQNYSGYPHLGYPSSQSPNPREGKISDLLIPVVCVCLSTEIYKHVPFRGALISFSSLHTLKTFFAC